MVKIILHTQILSYQRKKFRHIATHEICNIKIIHCVLKYSIKTYIIFEKYSKNFTVIIPYVFNIKT